jgi:hypothetical protein
MSAAGSRRRYLVVGALATFAIATTGCSGIRTERKGLDVGRSICDVKNADNADDAQRALEKLDRQLERAARITGRPVREDVRDITNNLDDLVQHVANGNDALSQQDVAAIRRNVQEVVDTAPGLANRFYEGLSQGLADCAG